MIYLIDSERVILSKKFNELYGKRNKSTNENIECLYSSLIMYLALDIKKKSLREKKKKSFLKYLGRVMQFFTDKAICQKKLGAKVQHPV